MNCDWTALYLHALNEYENIILHCILNPNEWMQFDPLHTPDDKWTITTNIEGFEAPELPLRDLVRWVYANILY